MPLLSYFGGELMVTRGYKGTEDIEELKRKLERKHELRVKLIAEVSELEQKLKGASTQLKRCDTYLTNLGRKLTLLKTYDGCWYERKGRGFFFLEEFLCLDEHGEPTQTCDEQENLPDWCRGVNFDRTPTNQSFVFKKGDVLHLVNPTEQVETYKLQRKRERLKDIGVLVPKIEFLVRTGNRYLDRLYNLATRVLVAKKTPAGRDMIYNRVEETEEKKFFYHHEDQEWYEIVLIGSNRYYW